MERVEGDRGKSNDEREPFTTFLPHSVTVAATLSQEAQCSVHLQGKGTVRYVCTLRFWSVLCGPKQQALIWSSARILKDWGQGCLLAKLLFELPVPTRAAAASEDELHPEVLG